MTRARQAHLGVAAAACIGLLALGAAAEGSLWEPAEMEEVVPAQSEEPLVNPGMGIYLFGTLDPTNMPEEAWFSKIISIGYFRDDWSELAPEGEGEYRFDQYFGPIFGLWVKQWGKRVAFRFMSANMHSERKYVTPKWVFDQGVPSVRHRGLYTEEQMDPVFWDERYLQIQERFIADLGRYLDGRPGLEFIDIGSIGEWGEMHLQRWTPQELEETGYSEGRYVAAYRRIIDAFAAAFPRTRVFLNVGDYEAINDYAALRGLHFRQDGLSPSGPSADVGKRFYHPYSRRGVICNYEFHSSYEDMKRRGWGVRETFEKGLEDPISYLHINLVGYWQLPNPPPEVEESVMEAARRVGFRFVLGGLRYNRRVNLDEVHDGRLILEQRWRNEGVAPCYDSYAVRWRLVDGEGEVTAESVVFPKRPTTRWWPGEEVVLRDMATIPAETPPGRYRLRVAMVKPEEPELRIQLGLAGRDEEGSYDVCEVEVERAASGSVGVYEEGFEEGTGQWFASEGMTARRDPDGKTGEACLLLTGHQPGTSWNYGGVNLTVPVRPYSRYRLSCWMRVEEIEGGEAPYLKIGLTDGEGRWLTNWVTDRYDLTRMGTWQRLVGYAETTPETAGGHMAVEKGSLEGAARATIRIDDCRLELVASP